MRKLFALLTIVFFAGFMMAQNTATITDNGNDNGAYIEQVGLTNTATVTQTGNNNSADITDIYHSSLYGPLNAKGITQYGNGNEGTITQYNGFSGTVSAGPIAGIGQYSNENTATISQSGNTAWMQGYAWAQQQGGTGNQSTQNQWIVSYQFSHVLQNGNDNEAETNQSGGYGQKANIYQSGDENTATQYQGLSSYTHTNLAEATQFGNSNESHQYQYGSTNTAKIIQQSDMNNAVQTQYGDQNTAEAYQYSDNNISVVTQTATSVGNTVFTQQWNGDNNIINLDQTAGSDAGNAVIYQNGANNVVQGLNADPLAISHDGSTLDVYQGSGNNNVLHLYQLNGADATVNQFGSSNNAVVIQN